MQDPASLQLPFVNRDQLAFEQGTTFALRITTQANVVARVAVRGCTREGLFTYIHSTDNSGLATSTQFGIADIPIFLSVTDFDFTFKQAQCHVKVALMVNGDELYELCSGTIYGQKSVSYPVSSTVDQRPGGGEIKTITGADPAAGAEHAITVTTGEQWRIMALRTTLVAAAAAGSRRVHFTIEDAIGNVISNFFGDTDQIISETKTYNLAEYGVIPQSSNNNQIMIPLPADIYVDTGFTIRTATLNLNAGDNFDSMILLVESWKRAKLT